MWTHLTWNEKGRESGPLTDVEGLPGPHSGVGQRLLTQVDREILALDVA